MLNIALGAYRTWPQDEYGQSSAGWRPGLTDEEVFAAGRGRWKLGPRADQERYVTFTAMGIVVLAAEIEGISQPDPDGRRMIRGTILKPGAPVYDRYVGKESEVGKSQNPVQYFASPFDRTLCACGCGGDAPTGKSFLPGHDQIAIHDRVKKVGGVLLFMEWFDRTWASPQA